MGRCGSCRTQTQHFCFVHQEFVCDTCLTSKGNIHGRCVVSTYRKWVQDSSYEWPPKCPACNIELEPEGDNIRRRCLHVDHAACVERSPAPDHSCAACKAPLQESFDGSRLGQVTLERVREMQALSGVVREFELEEPETTLPNDHVLPAEPLEPQFQRTNAALRVIETEAGTSVSHVATDDDSERIQPPTVSNPTIAPRPPPVPVTPQEPAAQKAPEIRIDMGIPPLKSKSGNVSYNKREKGGSKNVMASWRRTLKAGNRRLVDIRKALRENRGRFAVGVLFAVCVIMVIYLSSGEDDTTTASRPVVENVNLPHVRVNPAFVKGSKGSGLARLQEHERMR